MAQISLQTDHAHHTLGGVIVHHFLSDHESVEPLPVGPFDTPAEVLERALERLDRQLTLW